MTLYEAFGKLVRVTLTNGKVFEGIACDYTSALDNEPNPEAICIDIFELYAPEIEKIQVLD